MMCDDKNKKNWKDSLRFAVSSAAFGMVFGFGVLTYTHEVAQTDYMADGTTVTETEVVEETNTEILTAGALSAIGSTNLSGATGSVIDVSDLVEAALPSVVAVNCITYAQNSGMVFSYGMSPYGGNTVQEEDSCGTGILIGESDENLMILTNNHVIEDADVVSVVFVDGTEVEGSVLGADADADIAVILISLADIPTATRSEIRTAVLGDSDAVKVGEAAIAIGNALGYGQSVTTGVISAINREVNLTDKTMTLIQTDAAINGGNSGGPLLNAEGEVIGINTVKYAASGVEGMGYAIPITSAKPIIESIINGSSQQEQEGVLFGIYGLDITEQYQKMYQMPEGVYVYSTVEDSPAQKYNIQSGMIITAIDGQAVTCMEDLSAILEIYVPGDAVTVTVMVPGRGQYTEEMLQVILAARQE